MRLGYLVFDIDDNKISLLQTNCHANDTDMVEITMGKRSVPNSTPVANAVSATQGTGTFTSSTPTQATAASGLGGNATTSRVQRKVSLRRFGAMAAVVVVMFHALM